MAIIFRCDWCFSEEPMDGPFDEPIIHCMSCGKDGCMSCIPGICDDGPVCEECIHKFDIEDTDE